MTISGRRPPSRNAGSEERYAYVALSADLRIADAVAYREGRDPTVNVALLSSEAGGIADAPMIAAVEAALGDPTNRVVNGPFAVRSAVSSLTNVVASLVVHPGTSTQILATAEANLRAAFASESRLGFDLTRSWIVSRLMVPGVYGVTLTAPAADVVVPPYEMAGLGSVTLSIAGNAL